jgi:adenylate kinase family enzyme
MMGSGKSTFARSLAAELGLRHIEIDLYPSAAKVHEDICLATQGWVAEANPWQIPSGLANKADVVVLLDYDNLVNYARLFLRGIEEWRATELAWEGFHKYIVQRTVFDLGRIVYRYGRANRKEWRAEGMVQGIAKKALYLRCISPAELRALQKLATRKGSLPPLERVGATDE